MERDGMQFRAKGDCGATGAKSHVCAVQAGKTMVRLVHVKGQSSLQKINVNDQSSPQTSM
jgi:hypothetical protein